MKEPRETPSLSQQVLAQQVYDHLTTQVAVGVIVPVESVCLALDLDYQEVTTGFRWALRTICPTTGIYLGSRRGAGGGYYVTDDATDAVDDEVRWLGDTWTHLKKNEATALTRMRAGLGNRSTNRKVRDGLRASIDSIENVFEEHGMYVGHVRKDREAAARAAAKKAKAAKP